MNHDGAHGHSGYEAALDELRAHVTVLVERVGALEVGLSALTDRVDVIDDATWVPPEDR